jgi:lysophospholipase L1-like esterase
MAEPGQDDGAGRRWRRYTALGDSFTEGLCDPAVAAGHPWRGWADRVAEALAARARQEGVPFAYANLAVRGRLLKSIITEQLPAALKDEPDLVSIVGGGNDLLRPGADVDALSAQLEAAVVRVRQTGADVLLATPSDPRAAPVIKYTRGKYAVMNANIWTIARRHGALVVDLWGIPALQDARSWAPDRIHLTADGHARVAGQALQLLGLGGGEGAGDGADWAAPLVPLPALSPRQAREADLAWLRAHLVPWVGRRLRGRSSGDGLVAKRATPQPVPLPPPAPHRPASD